MIKKTGPKAEGSKVFIDLDKLEIALSKPPANIKYKSSTTTGGNKGRVFTKTIDGADRDITIYDNATDEEVRAQLEFLETGGNKKPEKKPEVNVDEFDFAMTTKG